MAVDTSPTALASPTENQDSLLDLAPEAEMQDISDLVSEAPTNMTESRRGVLLDDHHYFDDDIDTINIPYERPMRLPKGISSYQAAWILDEDSDASDLEDDCDDLDMDMDMDAARPEDGVEGLAGPAMTEMITEFGDDARSELFLDRPPDQETAEIAAFRSNRATDAIDDREFPDELELHPNVTARERLARYRGLKSLRTSKWETTEDAPFQPENWDRLAHIGNYKALKNKVLSEALVGGIVPGSRVLVHLRSAPRELVVAHSAGKLVALYGLLRHEHKQAVVNFSLTPSGEYVGPPIKAKDTLVVQVGPRRMVINPLFSQAGGTGRNNVAKFERFLVPGRTSVATVVGPVMWGSVPAVFWRQTEHGLKLVGSGSFVNVDQARVVAKRVVLTGHPFKIHKKLVTVRYMFFNAEDVAWFKAIPLFTKRGRSGFVKESLGTHGYFKATFDGKINPQDAVAISEHSPSPFLGRCILSN